GLRVARGSHLRARGGGRTPGRRHGGGVLRGRRRGLHGDPGRKHHVFTRDGHVQRRGDVRGRRGGAGVPAGAAVGGGVFGGGVRGREVRGRCGRAVRGAGRGRDDVRGWAHVRGTG